MNTAHIEWSPNQLISVSKHSIKDRPKKSIEVDELAKEINRMSTPHQMENWFGKQRIGFFSFEKYFEYSNSNRSYAIEWPLEFELMEKMH